MIDGQNKKIIKNNLRRKNFKTNKLQKMVLNGNIVHAIGLKMSYYNKVNLK